MRQLSDTTRSISHSQTSGEAGDIAASFTGYESIVDKANSVPIAKLFKMYGVRLDENNRKTTCPFKNHKGGRENTASFYYYPHTNTYHCYGCRQGNTPIDFIMNMERCNFKKAASKILENFASDVDEDFINDHDDFNERMQLMINYANEVRDFRLNHPDEQSFLFIEKNCQIFDTISCRHDLTIEALKVVVEKLIKNMKEYKL